MPFQSEKQRRFLHANHPEIAKRWERDYAHGGILDINESEEIIDDGGNEIALTDYNAAFDDPNDLSTGVKSLFRAKEGGNVRLGPHTATDLLAKKNPDGTRSKYQPPGHRDAPVGGPPGGGATSMGSGRDYSPPPTRAPDFVTHTPTTDPTPSDGGMGAKEQYIQTQYTSPEAIAAKTRRELREIVETGMGSPIEKYDTPKQHLADIPGTLEIGLQQNLYKTRVNANYTRTAYEQTLANQKAKLKSMGLQKLGKLGVMLVGFLAMGVPLGDALKYLPKTISIGKGDLSALIKVSLPVMKAKKAHIEALELQKGALLKDVDILNPNEMKNLDDTDFENINKELADLTKTRDQEDDDRGGPELPPQLGGASTEEMATEYGEYGMSNLERIRAGQAKYAAYIDKIEREKLAREDNPIVSGTEMDIIALGNSGGLANLFRVKNQ